MNEREEQSKDDSSMTHGPVVVNRLSRWKDPAVPAARNSSALYR